MQLPQQTEKPIYALKQKKIRAVLPKTVSLLVLGIIFHLGILLNISLLELTIKEEKTINMVSLVLLLTVMTLGIYFSFHKAALPYKFYKNKVCQGKKSVQYIEITHLIPHHDPIDRMFDTYSIKLSKDFFIRNIPEQIQMVNYVQQLIDYAKRTQHNRDDGKNNF